MLSELLSRNKSCADPEGDVWMRSLCITRAPTVSLSVDPPGGVLSLTGLTAVAVPTCCASAGPAVSSAAKSGNAMRFAVMTRCLNGCSVHDRHLPADHGGAAGLDQRCGAKIELSDPRINGNNQNKTRAQETDDHDLQMGLAIGAIDRMIHSRLRLLH